MYHLNKNSSCFFLALLLLSSCSSFDMKNAAFDFMLKKMLTHQVQEIHVAEISDENQFVFLDARSAEEFQVSHIKDAVRCGYDDFDIQQFSNLATHKKIVVYCSIGYRSEKIALQLKDYGYTNVYNLYGGIFEWANQAKPLYDDTKVPTKKVHAYNKFFGIWLNNSSNKVY